MIATYLKSTVYYIIDHFRLETKRHATLSFNFVLLVILFATIIYLLFSLMLVLVHGYNPISDDLEKVYYGLILELKHADAVFFDILRPLAVLCLGLYGSFIISCINDERLKHKTSYSLRDFFAFISAGEWNWFFTFTGVILLFWFLTFIPLRNYLPMPHTIGHSTKELRDYYDPFSTGHTFTYRILHCIDILRDVTKACLPYLFAVLFIVTVYEKRISPEIIRKYKAGIIAGLIGAFVLSSIIGILYEMLTKVIIGFLKIFFDMSQSGQIPAAICFVLFVAGMAYFTWAMAAALCLPIKMQAEGDEQVLTEYESANGDNNPEADIEAPEHKPEM